MDFSKVTIDGDVDDLDGDEARELISDFQTAQEQNIAEFEKASEQITNLEGSFEEFEDADEKLTAEVAEATFMSEDEAATLDFGRKREILASEDESEEGDDGDFDDMGQRGETHTETDDQAFAQEYIGDIDGLNF
jgi:hypothetical protein